MKLLLDTNVLLWGIETPGRISRSVRQALDNNPAVVSDISCWEIAIKMAVGKLQPSLDVRAWIEESGLEQLPISLDHIWTVRNLPLHHRDPFDRLLVAQALCEGLTVVTSDPQLSQYGVPVIRA